MKYLFIPGMNVTEQEFLTVKGLFMKENLFLEGLLENHLHFTTSKKSKLQTYYSGIEEISLICHSMGCNMGALVTDYLNVKNIAFVSPEFMFSSKKERLGIQKLVQQKYVDELPFVIESKSILDRLLLVGLFLRSRRSALQALSNLEVPIMVVYSEGDPFVSRKGIQALGTVEVMVETSHHNPFMSNEGKPLVKKKS